MMKKKGRKKKIIYVLLIILIIFSAVIGMVYRNNLLKLELNFEAIPEVQKSVARINEDINFSSEKSKGIIISYFWDFGDGNNSIESNPSHRYSESGWYNITLTIKNKEGKKDSKTIMIGIQQNDNENYVNLNQKRNYQPNNSVGGTVSSIIGPNIGHPKTSIKIEIKQIIGQVKIIIRGIWEISDDQGGGKKFYEEDIILFGENYNLDYSIEPEDFSKEMQMYKSEIETTILLYKGRWDSAKITIDILYPFENLQE